MFLHKFISNYKSSNISGDSLSALVSPKTKWDAAIFLNKNYVNYDVEKKMLGTLKSGKLVQVAGVGKSMSSGTTSPNYRIIKLHGPLGQYLHFTDAKAKK